MRYRGSLEPIRSIFALLAFFSWQGWCLRCFRHAFTPKSASTALPATTSRLSLLPKDIQFAPEQVEILRILGKIDVKMDKYNIEEAKKEIQKSGKAGKTVTNAERLFSQWNALSNKGTTRMTSVRIFEARIPGNTKCFLKEYLPIGLPFGRRELRATRVLSATWNAKLKEKQRRQRKADQEQYDEEEEEDPALGGGDNDAMGQKGSGKDTASDSYSPIMPEDPPFPVLLGSLRPDERIEDPEFQQKWRKRFPTARAPEAGNLWLVFAWDRASFRTFRKYPPLPQVVEGLDFFSKEKRDAKRWRFIRKIMRKGLESLDFLHKTGFVHNAVNSDSLWLTTTNQQEIDDLSVKITDLGAAQQMSELGPYAREGAMEDLYLLGFSYLQLVISCFNEDNIGAQIVRERLTGEKSKGRGMLYRKEEVDLTQLSQNELQSVFEDLCDADFQALREFCSSIPPWKAAVGMLEQDKGAGWRLIFKLLARGRLYDPTGEKPLKITGTRLIRDHQGLFEDTYA